MMSWMNAVGLIITSLPESYWHVLFDAIAMEIQSSELLNGSKDRHINPFEVRWNASDCIICSKIQYKLDSLWLSAVGGIQ